MYYSDEKMWFLIHSDKGNWLLYPFSVLALYLFLAVVLAVKHFASDHCQVAHLTSLNIGEETVSFSRRHSAVLKSTPLQARGNIMHGEKEK